MSNPIVTAIVDGRPQGDRVISLGSRRIVANVSGTGPQTVVLETGLGAESAEWAVVQQAVEGFATVFRYDRAGRGGSDPAPGPRSALEMVEELRLILREAGLPGPYVLVGHSYGGLLARLFAYHHRDEVVGLVLVDSLHEDQFDVFGPLFPPPDPQQPPELAGMRAFWTGGWRDPASTPERIDMMASRGQGDQITGLGDLPMRVMVAGSWLDMPMVPEPLRPKLQALWQGLQERLAALSTRARLVPVPTSGHFVQRDAPQVIVEVVRGLLEEVQR